ncbi:MAG: Chitin-binding protein CbpD [Stenotrophomonas maltophilia]|uniref:Chitin-binding protein CbpD n=1 Tax=Stenotrophomonas maltophilia TaxID=40324 RepID=A0A7V8JJZ3_STEMA|nr:MAG: Chitin-binding protein CbpD [Stenotrophomonas maltophilia]
MPDGKLCSGNNPTFRELDLARSDWQTTPIQPDVNGRFTFVFKATAPHATRDWRFFVTREGWQPGSALRWADLQEFCTLGNTPLSADGTYKLQCTLPQRSGQHVIYNTWQRSDSTEAFYTCMDVRFEGGGGGGGTPAPQWQDAGPLIARGELPVGTTLALRVFNAGGNDVERVEATLASGQTAPGQWPLVLARKVNASAQQARAGVLRDGVITPVPSATENRVFLKPGQRFQLDTRLPDTGTPAPGGEFDHVYPAGIGSYVPGQTVVKGSDGKLYACRPFPQGGWCNVSGEAYRPGVGSAWRDAWVPY